MPIQSPAPDAAMSTMISSCPPVTRYPVALRSSSWASSIGAFLLFLWILMPFRIQEYLSVFHVNPEGAANDWGTVFPHIGLLEIAALGYVAFKFMAGQFRLRDAGKGFNIFLAISGFCILWMWIPYFWGYSSEFYWDGLVELVRLSAVFWLFVCMAPTWAKRQAFVLTSLAATYGAVLVMYLIGFQNDKMEGGSLGRLNAPGLEVTSAGHFAAVLLLCGILFVRGWKRWLCCILGTSGLLIAGGRAPLLFLLLFVPWMIIRYWRSAWGKWQHVTLAAVGLTIILCLALAGAGSGLPIVGRLTEILNGQGQEVQQTVSAQFGAIADSDVASRLGGRMDAWGAAISALEANTGLPLGSDWRVQAELNVFGYPSHCHNTFLQLLLKFGVFALPLFVMLVISIWRGFRRRSPYAIILLFLLVGWLADYWLFVTKASLYFWAFILFNEMWIQANPGQESAR